MVLERGTRFHGKILGLRFADVRSADVLASECII
jgi:hypothetical protein